MLDDIGVEYQLHLLLFYISLKKRKTIKKEK